MLGFESLLEPGALRKPHFRCHPFLVMEPLWFLPSSFALLPGLSS